MQTQVKEECARKKPDYLLQIQHATSSKQHMPRQHVFLQMAVSYTIIPCISTENGTIITAMKRSNEAGERFASTRTV
jgi:hypothetical protein